MAGVGNNANAVASVPSLTTLDFYGTNSNESLTSEKRDESLVSAVNINKSRRREQERNSQNGPNQLNNAQNDSGSAYNNSMSNSSKKESLSPAPVGQVIRIKKGRKSAVELLRKAAAEEAAKKKDGETVDVNVNESHTAVANNGKGDGINSEVDAPMYIHSQGNNSAANPLQSISAQVSAEGKPFIDSSDSEHHDMLQSNLLANVSRVNRTDTEPALAVHSPNSSSIDSLRRGKSPTASISPNSTHNRQERGVKENPNHPGVTNTAGGDTGGAAGKPRVKPRPSPRPTSYYAQPVNAETTSEHLQNTKALKGVNSAGNIHMSSKEVNSLVNTPDTNPPRHTSEPLVVVEDTSSPQPQLGPDGKPVVKSILYSKSVYDQEVMGQSERDASPADSQRMPSNASNQLGYINTLTSLASVSSDQPHGDVMAKLGFGQGDTYFRADSPSSVPSASIESFSQMEAQGSEIANEVQQKLDARKQTAAQLGVTARSNRARGNSTESKQSSRRGFESDNEVASGNSSDATKSKSLSKRLSIGALGNSIFNSSRGSDIGTDDQDASDSSAAKEKKKKLGTKQTKGLGREAWEERIRNEKRAQEAQREYETFQRQLSEEKKLLLLAEYKAIREDRVANRYKEKMDKKAEKKMQKQQEKLRKEEHKLAAKQMKQLEKQGKGVNGFVRGTSITVPSSGGVGNDPQQTRPRSMANLSDGMGMDMGQMQTPAQAAAMQQQQQQHQGLQYRNMQRPGQAKSMHQVGSPSMGARQPMRGNQPPPQGSNIIRRTPSGNAMGPRNASLSRNGSQSMMSRGSPLQSRQPVNMQQQRRPMSGVNDRHPRERGQTYTGPAQTASPMQSQGFRRIRAESSSFRAARPMSQMVNSNQNINLGNTQQNPNRNTSRQNMGGGGGVMGSASHDVMSVGSERSGQDWE